MAEVVKEEVFRYAVKSAGFNMWLAGEHVHPKNGVWELNAKQHEELQKLIKTGKRPDITTELTYLDEKAAEATAKAYIASMKPAAQQGAAHSNTAAERQAGTDMKEVHPKAPAGTSLQERIRAQAASVLANAKEEDITHGEDATVKNMDQQKS